jgi:hypothetical protein
MHCQPATLWLWTTFLALVDASAFIRDLFAVPRRTAWGPRSRNVVNLVSTVAVWCP